MRWLRAPADNVIVLDASAARRCSASTTSTSVRGWSWPRAWWRGGGCRGAATSRSCITSPRDGRSRPGRSSSGWGSPQQDCPHPNACLTCPDFQTTPQFLPIHRRQRDGSLELLTAAEQAGNTRLADNHRDNHRQVATNLERTIDTLEAIDSEEPTDAAR